MPFARRCSQWMDFRPSVLKVVWRLPWISFPCVVPWNEHTVSLVSLYIAESASSPLQYIIGSGLLTHMGWMGISPVDHYPNAVGMSPSLRVSSMA